VRAAYRRERPSLVIHCAALSQSTACQETPLLARLLNVEVTALLADLASEIPFFFFSTDLVFDGLQGDYLETDEVNPRGVYAETKVAAESLVLLNPRHTVIRTSLNGGVSVRGDRAFNEQLRRAFLKGQKVGLFTDEYRNPLPAIVTARAVWEIACKGLTGIYHVAGRQRLSRFQIGQILAARWPDVNPTISPESLSSYRGAPRSPDTTLNCSKAQAAISFSLPGLGEWLEQNPHEPF